ncbi:MAG: AAA family ATPase [Planctomycetaceae bacterium]|nr:AAA family ATPase [Planctomycetaceae bacterium]
MHERYWGRNDFSLQGMLGQSGLIETAPHEEALARLGYLVEHRRRFGLMLGPAGTGKSLVLSAAAREAKRLGREVATIDLFGIDSHDLLWQLAIALRLGPTERWSHAALWRAVCDHWHALHSARLPSVLLFDHLERAEVDCLSMIERLLHLDVANDGCLTILAAAREGFDECSLGELAEQSELRIELPGLSQRETETFIRELLDKSGGHREIFRRDALVTLFDLSGGVPREVVHLCRLALAAAERDVLDRVDSAMLLDVAGELPRVAHPRGANENSLAGLFAR